MNDYYEKYSADNKKKSDSSTDGYAADYRTDGTATSVAPGETMVRVCSGCGEILSSKHTVCNVCDTKLGVLMSMEEAKKLSEKFSAEHKIKAEGSRTKATKTSTRKGDIACAVFTVFAAVVLVAVMLYTKYVHDLLIVKYEGDYFGGLPLENNLGVFFFFFILLMLVLIWNFIFCLGSKQDRNFLMYFGGTHRWRIMTFGHHEDDMPDEMYEVSWLGPVIAVGASVLQLAILLHEFMHII